MLATSKKMAIVLTLDFLKADTAKSKRIDFKHYLHQMPHASAPVVLRMLSIGKGG